MSAASGQSAAAETSERRKRGLAPSIRATMKKSSATLSNPGARCPRRLCGEGLGQGRGTQRCPARKSRYLPLAVFEPCRNHEVDGIFVHQWIPPVNYRPGAGLLP